MEFDNAREQLAKIQSDIQAPSSQGQAIVKPAHATPAARLTYKLPLPARQKEHLIGQLSTLKGSERAAVVGKIKAGGQVIQAIAINAEPRNQVRKNSIVAPRIRVVVPDARQVGGMRTIKTRDRAPLQSNAAAPDRRLDLALPIPGPKPGESLKPS